MMTIHLHQLQFFCHHGIHDEEKIIGGNFLVNIDIDLHKQEAVITSLSETISYVAVYQLVKQRMSQPTPLLETLAMEIAGQILAYSGFVKKVSVNIIKQAAPIVAFQGQVGVTYMAER